MNMQYCKIGKVKPILPDIMDLNLLEERHSSYIEEAYNLNQTDASLSDVLYYEAKKLKQNILNLKKVLINDLDVSF